MNGRTSQPPPVFRLEQCHRVNPFIVAYLAAAHGFASDLERCLADAIRHVTSAEDGERSWDLDGRPIDPAEFLELISPADGYASPALRQYLEMARQLSPELFSNADAAHLQSLLLSIIEEASTQSDLDVENYISHFVSNWRISAAYERRMLLLLYPFLPHLFAAVPDSETADILHQAVPTIVRSKGICSAAELHARVYKICGTLWSAYADFLAINNGSILTARSKDYQFYARTTSLFPHFELCSAGISPNTYLVTSGLSYAERVSPDRVKFSVHPERIIKFFEHWQERPTEYEVDWMEVALKLRLLRLERMPHVQGLDSALYRAVIGCLEREHIALQLEDFRRRLGIDEIPLSPFDLPPGRLLAYAPGPRFYGREAAFYVLREWVEDKDHRKRRIAKDRIVTPLEPRRCFVEPATIEAAIKRSELLSKCGCILAEAIVDDIARELLGDDVAGYYRRQISRVVAGALRRRFRHLGRGIFVDARWDNILADQSTKRAKLSAFRRMLNVYLAERSLDSEHFRRELRFVSAI